MNVKSIGREQNTRITGKAAYSIPSYSNSSRTFLPTPGKGRLALPPVKTIEQGAATSVLLAASPDVEGSRADTTKIADSSDERLLATSHHSHVFVHKRPSQTALTSSRITLNISRIGQSNTLQPNRIANME